MQITMHKGKYSFFILEHSLKFNLEPNLHSINILKLYLVSTLFAYMI